MDIILFITNHKIEGLLIDKCNHQWLLHGIVNDLDIN